MFERYYRELKNFLTRKVNDSDTASDLAQESYIRVLALQQSGAVIGDPRALLYRVARNLLVDRARHDAVRGLASLDALGDDQGPHAPTHLQPEAQYAALQYVRAMVQAIESLPPRCREAFILNRFDGLSHQEIADRMGISRNMVAQHIMRGVLVCKACDDRHRDRGGVGQAGE
ncbi:sigma-70 family RNA polymerase sigma factor [Denitromonas iodatirespirans]|uniref:Sigma-70 family RNA polymerase sigma factor n=1 Tax=Denitromonas iodatirespirans TaxID=2795389 RepID=A0A944H7M5_DENI1|nr:sigma-70 family RNA polymerase sigma factor [Denitromonas iodatirespirans]MBT0960460.1 sigma-70 family RNA polymerase sigma factor [Denitromonas iodatirespirans]